MLEDPRRIIIFLFIVIFFNSFLVFIRNPGIEKAKKVKEFTGSRRCSKEQVSHEPSFLPFVPNSSCPNFFMVLSEAGGIGHRINAIITAIHTSRKTNAAVALDDSIWAEERWTEKERSSLMYIRRLFDFRLFFSSSDLGVQTRNRELVLGTVQTKWGIFSVRHSNDIDHAANLANSDCNQIIELRSGYMRCVDRISGNLTYCVMDAFNSGAWESSRKIFRMLYERGQMFHSPLDLFHADDDQTIVVAWHVRNGDINLNVNPTFWNNLIRTIKDSTISMTIEHYVICEKDLRGGPFAFLYDIFQFSLLVDLPPDVSIHYMANSDILVSTGSSFSILAALLASPDQIHFFSEPKEGTTSEKVYQLSGSIPVLIDGTISESSAAILKTKIFPLWKSNHNGTQIYKNEFSEEQ
jgi:hypothetical protein